MQLDTYQADEQEEDQKGAAQDGAAVYVAVAHRRHGHDQKVDARPVRNTVRIGEFQRVARILQLEDISLKQTKAKITTRNTKIRNQILESSLSKWKLPSQSFNYYYYCYLPNE